MTEWHLSLSLRLSLRLSLQNQRGGVRGAMLKPLILSVTMIYPIVLCSRPSVGSPTSLLIKLLKSYSLVLTIPVRVVSTQRATTRDESRWLEDQQAGCS
eukprot:COSAG01_NODE_1168_length_11426_cov_339.595038_13_plen_99_part_00